MIEALEKVYNDVWTAFVGNHLGAHRAALAAVSEHVRKVASAQAPKAELTKDEVGELFDEMTADHFQWNAWNNAEQNAVYRTVNAALARHSVLSGGNLVEFMTRDTKPAHRIDLGEVVVPTPGQIAHYTHMFRLDVTLPTGFTPGKYRLLLEPLQTGDDDGK